MEYTDTQAIILPKALSCGFVPVNVFTLVAFTTVDINGWHVSGTNLQQQAWKKNSLVSRQQAGLKCQGTKI